MRLAELEAAFLKITSPQSYQCAGVSMAEADGVSFLCPKCFAKNGGPVGTHHMVCWAPGVDPARRPSPGRWPMTGTSLDDLTLSPSIQITGGCNAHFWIRDGAIVGLT